MRFEFARAGFDGREPQDRFRAHLDPERALLLLADGAGGVAGGLEAAEWAVRAGLEYATRYPEATGALLCHLFEEIDGQIHRAPEAGEATLILARVREGRVDGVAVGDSSAYLLDEGRLRCLTEEARPRPRLGSGRARLTPFGPTPLEGTLLLVTDGITQALSLEEIAALGRGPEPANALVEVAHTRGLTDDVTCLALQAQARAARRRWRSSHLSEANTPGSHAH